MHDDALILSSVVVHPWHCDEFGHMNTRHYASAFDDAIFVFWQIFVPTASAVRPVTVEMRTGFASEAMVGTVARITGRISRLGTKSVTIRLEMARLEDRTVLATCDVTEVFIDTKTRRSSAIPDQVRLALEKGLCPAV